MECASCKRRDISLAACSGCHSVHYCGVECQTRDWKNGHKDKCHLFAEMQDIIARSFKNQTPEKTNSLIGKPVKRNTPDDGNDDDLKMVEGAPKRDKEVTVTVVDDRPRPVRETNLLKVLAPLSRDVLRIISLMTLLDAPVLMRSTPAWRVFYEQIEWKGVILSRWNDSPAEARLADDSRKVVIPGGGLKSIGRWLFDYSIFRLYPNVLPGPPPQPGQDERNIFFERFQAIVVDTDAQHALMNICILYRMYEHNAAVFQMETRGVFPMDADSVDIVDALVQEYGGCSLGLEEHYGTPVFFPVEVLSKTLKASDGSSLASGHQSLIEFSRSSDRIDANNMITLQLGAISNIPRALVACNNIVTEIYATNCPIWSDTAFQNLCKMQFLTSLTLYSSEWRIMSADFFTACALLTELKISVETGRISVSPRYLQESSPGSGIFGARGLHKSLKFHLCVNGRDDNDNDDDKPKYHAKRLPPGPFAGLTRSGHIERIIRRTFEVYYHYELDISAKSSSNDVLRALAVRQLYPFDNVKDPRSATEYAQLFHAFCEALVEAAVSSAEEDMDLDDPKNRYLPFRAWFLRGIEYRTIVGGNILTIPSRAHEACFLSAEKRRGQGAFPSIEELAEALFAWRGTAYNLAILSPVVENTKVTYCLMLASCCFKPVFPAEPDKPWERGFGEENPPQRTFFEVRLNQRDHPDLTCFWKLDALAQQFKKRLTFPPELAMMFVANTAALMQSQHGKNVRSIFVTVNDFYGDVPVWMWLAHEKWTSLSLNRCVRPYVPPQLIYHPGLDSFTSTGSYEWGTKDNAFQWDLLHIAPEGRPGNAPGVPGTMLHEYHHGFASVKIVKATKLNFDCFPPMITSGYVRDLVIEIEAPVVRDFRK